MGKSDNPIDLIRESGLSVRKIARDTGIKHDRIYGWLYRNSMPKADDAQKIIEYLGDKIKPKETEPVIAVIIDRLSELLALAHNTSSTLERERIMKDVEQLINLKNSD